MCIAGTRLLLEESIADEFLALLKQQAQNWQPGHPLDPATTMGTLIDCAHADSVHSFIREGESKGQLLLDGRNAGLAAAIGPTIFVDVDPNASLSREEIFGPVLVVTRFTSEEQALQLANDSQYGLGAAVWTRDLSRAHRMSRRLKAGSVFVNNYNDGDMTVPSGGYKQSGNGRDKSLHVLEKFTELKTIWVKHGNKRPNIPAVTTPASDRVYHSTRLNESITADVCVIGGGYTGLSSALHLAEAGFDVVVLEASRIGFGASGRNGGQQRLPQPRHRRDRKKLRHGHRPYARQHDVRGWRDHPRTYQTLSD